MAHQQEREMSRGSKAIVATLKGPADRTCFLAFPFEEFQDVADVISMAACSPGVNLSPSPTNQTRVGIDFTNEIFHRVRVATLVAAVCTPEKSTGQPNPNVIFELGLAVSLRKPILILTTDSKSLPSDLRNVKSMVYDPADLEDTMKRRTLINSIRVEMTLILQQVRGGLTDGEYPDTFPVSTYLLDSAVWHQLEEVLVSVNDTRDALMKVAHVIKGLMGNQVRMDKDRAEENVFLNDWNAYLAGEKFPNLQPDDIARQIKSCLSTCAQYCRLCPGEPGGATAKFQQSVETASSELVSQFERARGAIDEFLRNRGDDARARPGQIGIQLRDVWGSVIRINSDLHNLLCNLLKRLAETSLNETDPPPQRWRTKSADGG